MKGVFEKMGGGPFFQRAVGNGVGFFFFFFFLKEKLPLGKKFKNRVKILKALRKKGVTGKRRKKPGVKNFPKEFLGKTKANFYPKKKNGGILKPPNIGKKNRI